MNGYTAKSTCGRNVRQLQRGGMMFGLASSMLPSTFQKWI